MTVEVLLVDDEATQLMGVAMARACPRQAVVYMQGDLGAGKTTLARALLRALGVTGAIRSPTYTLIERYATSHGEAVHLDLYRVADPEELHFLGLEDLSESAHLWLVEWAERGHGALPKPDLRIELKVQGDGRLACLDGVSAVGQAWIRSLRDGDHAGFTAGF
jgi:tRNA threonylcarbamoyladenosine biosynthesis protein TsaE